MLNVLLMTLVSVTLLAADATGKWTGNLTVSGDVTRDNEGRTEAAKLTAKRAT